MNRGAAVVRLEAVHCDHLFTASNSQFEDFGRPLEDLVGAHVLWGQRASGGAPADIHKVR